MASRAHALVLLLGLAAGGMGPAHAADESGALLERVLAAPAITPAAGFTATMKVAPGQLYDPLWLHVREGRAWLNDDGGEEGESGSRLLTVAGDGALTVAVPLGRLLPVTGYDFAPAAFGRYAGAIYSLAQARVAAPGTVQNHVIQRIDPRGQAQGEVVCTLPATGPAPEHASGFGVDARFGPAGTPFADRFFALTAFNNSIYQVDKNHACRLFVTFSGALAGAPLGMTFAPDGNSMLVSLKRGGFTTPSAAGSGLVVRVHADGTVDERPVATGLTLPGGLVVAPPGFAGPGGRLFVTDMGEIQSPVPMTQALARDGRVYRVGDDGALTLVASGFVNPLGLEVIDGALWVTDINGDFIAGKRELPDGFVVTLTPR